MSSKTRQHTRKCSATKPKKSYRTGLSPVDEHRLRRRLRQSACSEPWVDAQIKTLHDQTSEGDKILVRYHDPNVFPPGGRANTPMRWCRHCGRYSPPNCTHLIEHRPARTKDITTSTLLCEDCRVAEDDQRYSELYDAGLHLRPASSSSFVRMADLLTRQKSK